MRQIHQRKNAGNTNNYGKTGRHVEMVWAFSTHGGKQMSQSNDDMVNGRKMMIRMI
jgi:hypothetical protein